MKKKLECILLIDDNEADNFLHELAIKKADCAETIVARQDARLALEALRQGRLVPDLIFLDINMPGMNGWEFLDEYERLPHEQPKAPVVVMLTTSVNPADREIASHRSSLRGFYVKPLTVEACEKIVHDHFPE